MAIDGELKKLTLNGPGQKGKRERGFGIVGRCEAQKQKNSLVEK